MSIKQSVCLLNDSFPPQIDGVSNAVLNYATNLEKNGTRAMVVTPSFPGADDSAYTYPVVRYPSVGFSKMDGYMAGIPFSPDVATAAEKNGVTLLHSHCPIMSTFMARELRQVLNVPIVLTYHTKFDVDIANITKNRALQEACKKALAMNISICDEVWAVSRGAGENLKSLGYTGDYTVMPNGVDLPRGRVPQEKIAEVTKDCGIPAGIPVYMYVGRMMWYKGIRISVDALAKLAKDGKDFRMVFIGSGNDLDDIREYTEKSGISDKCVFTGAVYDREALRAWYCRADLFLFPSTFDTNGLVVREAAACGLGAVLIRGSAAAEDVTEDRNGFLIEENADSMYECLSSLYREPEKMHQIGANAEKELYMSWEDAVKNASARYEVVTEKYRSAKHHIRFYPGEGMMKMNGEMMSALSKLSQMRKQLQDRYWE